MKEYNDLLKVVKEGPINYDLDRKKEFKKKSMAFLKRLAKDLDLISKDIHFNASGIAVSGETTLMGMWKDGNGIYINISDDTFMFRSIKHNKDYSGGNNNFIWSSWNSNYSKGYEDVLSSILKLKK